MIWNKNTYKIYKEHYLQDKYTPDGVDTKEYYSIPILI